MVSSGTLIITFLQTLGVTVQCKVKYAQVGEVIAFKKLEKVNLRFLSCL